MATFKCDNCGELNHESERITNPGPTSINKLVQLIALFIPGSGGSRGMFASGNVCKKCQSQVYAFIVFIMLLAGLFLFGFLSKIKLI
jgi:hypothetical protein